MQYLDILSRVKNVSTVHNTFLALSERINRKRTYQQCMTLLRISLCGDTFDWHASQ